MLIMKPDAGQPKGRGSKPGSKTDATDDLKSLPLAEVEKKFASSPDGPDRWKIHTRAPRAFSISTARRAISGDRRCSAMTARSGVASTPPLNPPTGVVIPSGLNSIRSPRGGRLLIIEKTATGAGNS